MEELEKGYYWVSFRSFEPIILEKDGVQWYAFGTESPVEITNYKILGKVSNTIEEIK